MGIITSEGLAQEYRVLKQLCTVHNTRLQTRGVTPERLTSYSDSVAAMESQRAVLEEADSAKKQLTQQEETQRNTLTEHIRIIQKGVKNVFADGSPQRSEFHIGDKLNSSTAHVLGWTKDIGAGWEKYKDVLISGGLLQTDIDAMQTTADALTETDTAQEVAKKKTTPEATAALHTAIETVRKAADALHGIAAVEFKKEPALANQFEQAKKLRFEQSSKGGNGETPPPATPAPKP